MQIAAEMLYDSFGEAGELRWDVVGVVLLSRKCRVSTVLLVRELSSVHNDGTRESIKVRTCTKNVMWGSLVIH